MLKEYALGLLALLLLAALVVADEKPGQTVVKPVDNQAELRNPGMGFVLYFYNNGRNTYGSKLAASDLLEDWPGLTTVYMRLPWSDLEPEEGVYDWNLVDFPLRRFAQAGLRVAFRFTCTESFGSKSGTPQWVQAKGAKGMRFTHGNGPREDGNMWEPDYDDPIFLEAFDRFLAAAAARYDGSDEVAFIDVGSFGVWGEGHTWFSTNRGFSHETIITHLEMHRKHFKKTPVLGIVGYFERNGAWGTFKKGVTSFNAPISIPLNTYGKTYELRGSIRNAYTGNLKIVDGDEDNTVLLGTLTISEAGVPSIKPTSARVGSEQDLDDKDVSLSLTGITYDPVRMPHSALLALTCVSKVDHPYHVRANIRVVDPATGQALATLKEHWNTADVIQQRMLDLGMGIRTDSVLVNPSFASNYHAHRIDPFWEKAPVKVESAHYGLVKDRFWGDGSDFLLAIEDNHASYASIHYWPREFLQDNRELVRQINQRLGYRFQLIEAAWPMAVTRSQRAEFRLKWCNAGVAPCYFPLYPTITFKDEKGGIVASFTLDKFRLDSLKPGPKEEGGGEPVEYVYTTMPLEYEGTYDVYISAGDVLGKPLVELPLDDSDGAKRYRIGKITLMK